MPPFVPGGTGLKLVTRRGGERDKIPSSDAKVSPKQHAKCLRMPRYDLTSNGASTRVRLTLMWRRAAFCSAWPIVAASEDTTA